MASPPRRNQSGRFARKPAAQRTEAYNRRLRNVLRRRVGGPRPTREAMRGHAPAKVAQSFTEDLNWSRSPQDLRGRPARWLTAFRVRTESGALELRTVYIPGTLTWAQVSSRQDELEQRGRTALMDMTGVPFSEDKVDHITSFLGFFAYGRA